MAIIQGRSRRKSTGGRYHSFRDMRKFEFGREPTLTKMSDNTKRKVIEGRSNILKVAVLRSNIANVLKEDRSFVKANILKVVSVPANRNYQIRNIITKGTILDTDAGFAKVTSRPGRDGTINAISVKKEVAVKKKSKSRRSKR